MNNAFDLSFESFFRENNDLEFSSISQYALTKSYTVGIIIMDFTFLNTKFKTYGPGNQLRDGVLNYIKEDKNIIYFIQVSGKIIIFSENDFGSLREKLSKIEGEFKKAASLQDSKTPRLIYFVDSSGSNFLNKHELDNFHIGNFGKNLGVLIERVFYCEENLNSLRGYFQELFKREGQDALDFYEKRDNNFLDLKKLDSTEIYDSLKNNFESSFSNLDKKHNLTPFIRNLLLELRDDYGINDDIKNSLLVKCSEYLIWFEIQVLEFIAWKIENVYMYFEREVTRKIENNAFKPAGENEVSSMNILKSWFNSIFTKIPYGALDLDHKKQYGDIKNLVESNNELSKDLSLILAKKVQNFFDGFHMMGFFNIPLSDLEPSDLAKKGFFILMSGRKYRKTPQEIFSGWMDASNKNGFSFKGKKYYLCLSDSFEAFKAYPFIIDLHQLKSNDFRFHTAFLELDGFNAFNTYNFPNHDDSICYKSIVDSFYEVAYNLSSKSKDHLFMLSNMLVCVKGDEFYFNFLTDGQITTVQKKVVEEYLFEIHEKILKITSSILFPKNRKVKCKSSKMGEIVFRENFKDSSGDLVIGKLSVSGAVVYDVSFDLQDRNLERNFNVNTLKPIEKGVDQVKKGKEVTSMIEKTYNLAHIVEVKNSGAIADVIVGSKESTFSKLKSYFN